MAGNRRAKRQAALRDPIAHKNGWPAFPQIPSGQVTPTQPLRAQRLAKPGVRTRPQLRAVRRETRRQAVHSGKRGIFLARRDRIRRYTDGRKIWDQ